MNKLVKIVIAALLCWFTGFGIRLLTFMLPISHFWQTVFAVVVALAVFAFCAVKIMSSEK
jgi:hypothetical protein